VHPRGGGSRNSAEALAPHGKVSRPGFEPGTLSLKGRPGGLRRLSGYAAFRCAPTISQTLGCLRRSRVFTRFHSSTGTKTGTSFVGGSPISSPLATRLPEPAPSLGPACPSSSAGPSRARSLPSNKLPATGAYACGNAFEDEMLPPGGDDKRSRAFHSRRRARRNTHMGLEGGSYESGAVPDGVVLSHATCR